MADNYNPHLQGSDTMPSSSCDSPIAKETAQAVQRARDAVRQHQEVNKLAERGRK